MSSSSPSSSWEKPDVTLSLAITTTRRRTKQKITLNKPEEKGVEMIRLLLSCANHISLNNVQRADDCLSQIAKLANIDGDSIQRLVTRFALSLAVRLIKRWSGLCKALDCTRPAGFDRDHARSLFNRALPCVGFGYAVVNALLTRSTRGESVVHVIELGCGDPSSWVCLMKSLASGPDGPRRLKITCVNPDKEARERYKGRLVEEANGVNVPFEFNHVNASLSEVNLEMLNVRPNEAIAVVSILSLHTLLAEDDSFEARFGLGRGNEVKDNMQMNKFLQMMKSVKPKMLLLLEQESNHNSNRFVDRFAEALRYYGALFDLTDVLFGGFSCSDRVTLEEMFGREIENIVAEEGVERIERHERYSRWAVRFSRVGFRPVQLWYDVFEEAQTMFEAYAPFGFKIINQKGALMICWQDRPIYTLSAWI